MIIIIMKNTLKLIEIMQQYDDSGVNLSGSVNSTLVLNE